MNCSLSTHRSLGPSNSVLSRARSIFVTWLLVVTLFVNSIPAALAKDDDQFKEVSNTPTAAVQTGSFEEAARETAKDSVIPIDAEKNRSADLFMANQDLIIQEALEMATRLEERVENRSAELGPEKAFKMIVDGQKDSFRVEDAKMGFAEPTTVKNNPKNGVKLKDMPSLRISRFVHKDTGIVVLILPPEVDPESEHMKMLVARQNLVAGDNGRHAIVLRISNDFEDMKMTGASAKSIEKAGITNHPKPRTFKERMIALKRATWAGLPDAPTFVMATVSAGAQFMIAAAMSLGQNMINKQGFSEAVGNIDYRPAILSFAFGFVIGNLISSWKNFTNMPKDKRLRTIRNAYLSVAFAYGLKVWVDGGFDKLSLLETSGWLAHASIAINVWVNNIAKDYWSEFIRIRDAMGITRNKYVLKYFPKSNFEFQLLNLGGYTLKMADLVAFSIFIPVVGTLKLGKLLFLSSMWWVQWLNVKYAVSVGYEKSGEIKAKWEAFLRLKPVAKFVKEQAHILNEAAEFAFVKSKAFCQNLLTNKNGTKSPLE